ncbi:MAG: DUF5011 domain-containing protein, partial [Nitrosarchaeum sp.]|nr:DUF5011 domain-containing protein [Nitrosarchaeum sp.]
MLLFSSAFTGSLSNFFIVESFADTNTTPSVISKAGVDTRGTGTGATLSFSHTLVSGDNRLIVVSIGLENGQTYDISSVKYGDKTMTKAVDEIIIAGGTPGYIHNSEIWYILEEDLPNDGPQQVVITGSGTRQSLEINGFASQYNGVSQGPPEKIAKTKQTSPNKISNNIEPSNNAWVISLVGSGNRGNFAHGQGQIEIFEFDDDSSTVAVAELRGANGQTSLDSTLTGNVNRLVRIAASWQPADIDTTAPVITLLGNTTIDVEVNSTYEDAGATAFDNYDGDITGSIIITNSVDTATVGTYTVTYDVSDISGNHAIQVTRTVNVVDTTAPVITLTGANPQHVIVGSPYVELGAT